MNLQVHKVNTDQIHKTCYFWGENEPMRQTSAVKKRHIGKGQRTEMCQNKVYLEYLSIGSEVKSVSQHIASTLQYIEITGDKAELHERFEITRGLDIQIF